MRENFIPEIMRAGQARHRHFDDQTIELIFENKLYHLKVESGKNILDAALQQGLHLPYSCKGGICGNCAAKCTKGKVYMSINEVLSNADLDQGWVLTCTGFPESKGVAINFDNV